MKKPSSPPPFRRFEITGSGDRVFIKGQRDGRNIATAGLVSESDAEAAGLVVCIRLAEASVRLPNFRTAPCSVCGETVMYSPACPVRPPKLCAQCAAVTMALSGQSPALVTTRTALEEVDRALDAEERRRATHH